MTDNLFGNAVSLRQELSVRNASYASLGRFPHALSYGHAPVVVYRPSDCGRYHGNFIAASYRAILKRPEWHRRLRKTHAQARHFLPQEASAWRELDSCTSSDALLMNIFCYPAVTKNRGLALCLGTEVDDVPEFGFRPRVPLLKNILERTEVDMKLGNVLFEAKLTETDFQIQSPAVVEQYRDLEEVFNCRTLPRRAGKYVSYQLLRNVLAAPAHSRKLGRVNFLATTILPPCRSGSGCVPRSRKTSLPLEHSLALFATSTAITCGTPPKRLSWAGASAGRGRIDWPRTNGS